MYKIKNSYIDKMIEKGISSKEIDFILEIALSQDEQGVVHSVYYKNVCDKINISYQKFYDILAHLEEMGLISVQKNEHVDYSVRLIGNDFTHAHEKAEDPLIGGKAFSFGYLKVAGQNFSSDRFTALKAGAKLLYLYFQRFTNGKHMLLHNFYDEHSMLLSVTPRSLQTYLKELSDSKLLGIGRSRNKAYHYEIRIRNTKTIDKTGKEIIPTENDFYRNNIMDLIRVNFRRALPENAEQNEQTLTDIDA